MLWKHAAIKHFTSRLGDRDRYMLLTRITAPQSDLLTCSALSACWPSEWPMQMKTSLVKIYKIFSPQDSSSTDVFWAPSSVCLIVNFSAQHCLKQLLSYGEQGWKLLSQTFQIHLLLLLLDTDSLVTMKTFVLRWLEVLRRPAQLPALHLPGLGGLHHDGRQPFGQLGVLLTGVWEGLGRHLGDAHQSFAQGCLFRASTVCPFHIWHVLTCPFKNPLPTGADQQPCTGRISKPPQPAEPNSLLARHGAERL